MRSDLDEQEKNVTDAMEDMTSQQQEIVVLFWEEDYNFLINVIEWIRDVFNTIADKIRQGWHLVREVVTGLFSEVYALIKSVF